ncbi:MAG: pyridoxal phosphate-dependent decarboxylase family protein [Polyangiales bacterium]
MRIPETGLSKEQVAAALETARQNDLAWRKGRAFAYVYDGGKEIEEVGKAAYMAYLTENGLDPTVFPSLLRFENDLVSMARAHLGGDENVVGTFTSGGTESLMLAVKAARDMRKDVREPEMVLPITAHAAFFKAAHYLGVKAVPVAVDPETFRADPAAMRAAITDRTILLVASASSYAHGVVDPIREIGEIATEKNLLFHVDGCIGGFLLPYFKQLGAKVPDFDFSVPGVTSMSMDFHKYALCPKGASMVVYRNKSLRRSQIFACSSWTGYTMINTTIQSSKSGGPLAAAWAVTQFVGENGYRKIARELLTAKTELVAGIRDIPGIRLLGDPEMTLIAFASDELSVFALADAMKAKGWYIQPQLAYGPSPANVHLSVQPGNVPWTAPFLADLRACVEGLRGKPQPDVQGMAAMLVEQLRADPSAMAQVVAMTRAQAQGSGPTPDQMAETNHLLNALPRDLQEALLTEYVNEMFIP